jgi:DNA repair ATPase RecN
MLWNLRAHRHEKWEDEEMLLTKKLKMGLFGFAVLLVAAVAPSASAESPRPNGVAQAEVADRLADFKGAASQLRREADALDAYGRSRVSWQSHTHQLQTVKDHVNQLGVTLAELEALKLHASESQRMAIEHARPHLDSVAQSTTQAFELIKDNRGSIHFPQYGEAVSDIYEHADVLHMKLDAILEYEDAKARFDTLELEPMSTEGS